MPNDAPNPTTTNDVTALVGEIHQLKQELEVTLTRDDLTKLYDETLAGLTTKGEFDPNLWNNLAEPEKVSRAIKLAQLKHAFSSAVAAAEPPVIIPHDSFMYRKAASNDAILLLTAVAFIGLFFNLVVIYHNWTLATAGVPEPPKPEPPGATSTPTPSPTATARAAAVRTPTPSPSLTASPAVSPSASTTSTPPATPVQTEASNTEATSPTKPETKGSTREAQRRTTEPTPGPTEGNVMYMVMLMGSLGGFLRLASSLANYVGNRQLLKSWIVYYLLTPIQGAALAPLIYLLLRVGVLNPATTSGSAQPATSLNLIGIYAFAGLTGLFAKQAMEMLAEVFSTIFKKSETKDALNKAKPAETKPPDKPPQSG